MRAARRVLPLAVAGALAGCLGDLDARAPREHRIVAGGDAREAPRAMRAYGCGDCHTIPGVRGADALVGPPLASFSRRRYLAGRLPTTPESLVLWIRNPQGVKPGTAMPNLGVSDRDARHMAAYLLSLE